MRYSGVMQKMKKLAVADVLCTCETAMGYPWNTLKNEVVMFDCCQSLNKMVSLPTDGEHGEQISVQNCVHIEANSNVYNVVIRLSC